MSNKNKTILDLLKEQNPEFDEDAFFQETERKMNKANANYFPLLEQAGLYGRLIFLPSCTSYFLKHIHRRKLKILKLS